MLFFITIIHQFMYNSNYVSGAHVTPKLKKEAEIVLKENSLIRSLISSRVLCINVSCQILTVYTRRFDEIIHVEH